MSSHEPIDMSTVIAFDARRPVPTAAQLGVMRQRGVTPEIIKRADGTLLFIGATDPDGEPVDND